MKNTLLYVLLLWSAPLFSQDTIEWVIPMGKYYQIDSWNGYLLVGGKEGWSILDENLHPVTESRFEKIQALGEWALAIKENGKWGFRHRENLQEWAIQPLYTGDYWGATRENKRANTWLFTKDDRKWAITTTREKIVVEEPGKQDPPMEKIQYNGGAMDVSPQPLKSLPWHNQWAEVYPLFTYYDYQKKDPGKDVFEIIDKQQRHGMADAKGRVLIPARYAGVDIVNSKTVAVKEFGGSYPKEGYLFFSRSDGKRMSSKKYEKYRVSQLSKDAPIQVWERPSAGDENMLCGLLSASGEERVPCTYEYFEEDTPPGFVPAMQYKMWGLVSIKNKVLLPLDYRGVRLTGFQNSSFVIVSTVEEVGVLRVK